MDSYLEFVIERLGLKGNVTAKAMFGGHGIYYGDLMFGLVADGVLYLKVAESNIKDILESNEDLPKWIDKAIDAAKTAKPKKSYLSKYKSIKSKVAAKKKKLVSKKKKPVTKKKSKAIPKKPVAKKKKKK